MVECNVTTEAPITGADELSETLVLRVEDMTCAHCAGTITEALEAGLPGAKVRVDLATRLVTIKGARHPANIAILIRQAGYTPTCAPIG
jgi:copper chaperone